MIIVGISGGVDSAVTALRLQQQGYQVEALFMKNWEEDDDDDYCSVATDLADAQAVCDKLDIPLHTVNFATEYWDNVFSHCLDEFKAGRTPNPDVLCNREIKFKVFREHALRLGAEKIATGHYARNHQATDAYQLLTGKDKNKDQSYFLYLLDQEQLADSLFPLGEIEKTVVRQMATDADLIVHDKKDSTGICFIGERPFKDFLQQYIPAQPGEMVDINGTRLGQHDGLMYYTLGQRKGLNIGGQKQGSGEPWFVVDKDLDNNQLIVGQGHNHPRLFKPELYVEELHWITGKAPEFPYPCQAKIRYRQQAQACTVYPDAKGYRIEFTEPQRSVTPGQSVVLYQAEQCLGGGIIL